MTVFSILQNEVMYENIKATMLSQNKTPTTQQPVPDSSGEQVSKEEQSWVSTYNTSLAGSQQPTV